MSDGWVCLHRKILEWEWYDDANTFRLFVHCLLSANHKSAKWRSTEVKRGQFVSSRQKLSTALKLSEQQIRTALKKLEITGEITSEGTSQHTVFTVVNYDQYQNSNQQNNQQITSETTNEQPTDNQRITTNNNDNNKNNKDSLPETGSDKPGEPIKIAKPNGKHSNKILFEKIAEIYNERLGGVMPSVQVLSEKRQRLLKARCSTKFKNRELDNPEFWTGYFNYVSQSEWLTGKNQSGWTADFDWLIEEKNFIRVLEGSYHNNNGGNA